MPILQLLLRLSRAHMGRRLLESMVRWIGVITAGTAIDLWVGDRLGLAPGWIVAASALFSGVVELGRLLRERRAPSDLARDLDARAQSAGLLSTALATEQAAVYGDPAWITLVRARALERVEVWTTLAVRPLRMPWAALGVAAVSTLAVGLAPDADRRSNLAAVVVASPLSPTASRALDDPDEDAPPSEAGATGGQITVFKGDGQRPTAGRSGALPTPGGEPRAAPSAAFSPDGELPESGGDVATAAAEAAPIPGASAAPGAGGAGAPRGGAADGGGGQRDLGAPGDAAAPDRAPDAAERWSGGAPVLAEAQSDAEVDTGASSEVSAPRAAVEGASNGSTRHLDGDPTTGDERLKSNKDVSHIQEMMPMLNENPVGSEWGRAMPGAGGVNEAGGSAATTKDPGPGGGLDLAEEWLESRWRSGPEGLLHRVAHGQSGGRSEIAYRDAFVRYQAVAEAELRGDGIPASRRAFARRYFEAIRPQPTLEGSDDP